MSFDINPSRNLSNVQASAKTCSGGGGNTGYFQRGGSGEEESSLNFAKDYENDSFVKEGTLDEIQQQGFLEIIKGIFSDLIEAIKGLFIKK